MQNTTPLDWGEEAQRRLHAIAACSEDGPGVTRLPYTREHRRAVAEITGWMQRAGLRVHLDAAATLVGHNDGAGPALLIGSHQDSVRSGGRYDGIMGVVIGCLALEKLRHDGFILPFPAEVLAFADEEGVRFPTALIGSRALAGTFDPAVLDMTDRDGMRLGDALDAFGGDSSALAMLRRDPADVAGYLEIHIEQGPVLESADRPLGIVTAICGIERNQVTFTGETGHAGTVPMESRRDALVAAAAFMTAVNEAARTMPDTRATVGSLQLHPDVVNAIPDRVTLTLELRAPVDADRAALARRIRAAGDDIARSRGTAFAMIRTYAQPAVACAAPMMHALGRAVEQTAGTASYLPSGATHDASAMADLCPMAMLFVRCRGGLSHSPDEYATAADMGAAVEAVAAFLADRACDQSVRSGRHASGRQATSRPSL